MRSGGTEGRAGGRGSWGKINLESFEGRSRIEWDWEDRQDSGVWKGGGSPGATGSP